MFKINSLEMWMSYFVKIFFQASPLRDEWIFKKILLGGFDEIAPDFWLDEIKCYELHIVTPQNNMQFINILNVFQTTT